VSAGWPGPSEKPIQEPAPRPKEPDAGVSPGRLDPALIHRARAINSDALKAIDDLLDQIADQGRR
jgi:hypothetical protein